MILIIAAAPTRRPNVAVAFARLDVCAPRLGYATPRHEEWRERRVVKLMHADTGRTVTVNLRKPKRLQTPSLRRRSAKAHAERPSPQQRSGTLRGIAPASRLLCLFTGLRVVGGRPFPRSSCIERRGSALAQPLAPCTGCSTYASAAPRTRAATRTRAHIYDLIATQLQIGRIRP